MNNGTWRSFLISILLAMVGFLSIWTWRQTWEEITILRNKVNTLERGLDVIDTKLDFLIQQDQARTRGRPSNP